MQWWRGHSVDLKGLGDVLFVKWVMGGWFYSLHNKYVINQLVRNILRLYNLSKKVLPFAKLHVFIFLQP